MTTKNKEMEQVLISRELLEAISGFIDHIRFELDEDIDEDDLESQVNCILNKIQSNLNMYTLVKWPDSQELMDKPWFKNECFLADNDSDIHFNIAGSSAYFVPINRIEEMKQEVMQTV